MKKHYIQAVLEMVRDGQSPDAVLTGLTKLLESKGHQSLKASVLQGVLRVLEAKSDRAGARVVLAKASDREALTSAITAALAAMGVNADYQIVEDETIIGGFVATAGNTVVDASYKSALVKLYRNITK